MFMLQLNSEFVDIGNIQQVLLVLVSLDRHDRSEVDDVLMRVFDAAKKDVESSFLSMCLSNC